MSSRKVTVVLGRTIGALIAFSSFFAFSQELPRGHDHQSNGDIASDSSERGDQVVEEYRNYEPVERIDWSDANQTVDQIGGWRTYARDVYRYQRSKREEPSNQ